MDILRSPRSRVNSINARNITYLLRDKKVVKGSTFADRLRAEAYFDGLNDFPRRSTYLFEIACIFPLQAEKLRSGIEFGGLTFWAVTSCALDAAKLEGWEMNELLEFALNAHGGLRRWHACNDMKAEISVKGTLWALKQRLDGPTYMTISAATHEEHVILHPFPSANSQAFFEPDCVTFETVNEELLDSRDYPHEARLGSSSKAIWDNFDIAYFCSYTLWNYLTSPFLFTYQGFASRELPLWHENGEEWRRLEVSFPDEFIGHSRQQTAYFGQDGLLRRCDYTIDVLAGIQCTDYALDYREFDGMMVATGHRVEISPQCHLAGSQPSLFSVNISNAVFW
jgi:hypothetical protein